jgi:hypothetical protein
MAVQATVHPNANSAVPVKYYQFAGKVLGKILYQSAVHSPQVRMSPCSVL